MTIKRKFTTFALIISMVFALCIGFVPVFSMMVSATTNVMVYADGYNGSNDNDGLTEDTPVRDLKKALELAGNNGTIVIKKTLKVTSDIMGSNQVSLENVVIERWSGFTNGELLSLTGSEGDIMELTIKNTTMDGKNVTSTLTSGIMPLVYVGSYSKLIIDEGSKLINNNSAAVQIYSETASAEMKGGEISGNYTNEYIVYGSGVHVDKGTFTMSGGVIKNNSCNYYFGGGVLVNYGKFEMIDGEISDNFSHSGGAGVAINEGAFIMSGGRIINNVASCANLPECVEAEETQYGGGVYLFDLNADNEYYASIDISGGEISGNDADFGKAISFMSRTANYSFSISGSPKIVEEIDVGPASVAKPINVVDEFTPVVPVTMHLWSMKTNNPFTPVATYADGLTPNAFDFKSYLDTCAPTVEGQQIIMKNAPTITQEPTVAEELKYTGAPLDLLVEGTVEENGVYIENIPSVTNAGVYKVWYYVKGNEDYGNTVKNSIDVMVGTQIVVAPIIENKFCNGELQVADVSQSTLYTVTQNNGGTSSGKYDVILTLTDTDNYKWEATDETSITLTFEIVHNLVDVEAKDATCTEDGYTAHKACAGCEYTEGKEILSKTGHTAGTEWCHDEENHWYECENCDEVMNITSHTDEDKNGKCDVCDAVVPVPGLSGGAITGIVIASVAVIGVGGFSLFWFVIKKKKWSDLIAIFKKK